MSLDAFLKFEGGSVVVEGESLQTGHEKEIELLSLNVGSHNNGSLHRATGGGTEKGDFQDFGVTMNMDKSVPLLMMCCASGEHFDKAIITVRKTGGDKQVEYLKYELEPVMISNVQFSDAAGSDGAMVSLGLNYGKITAIYKPQNPDGTMGGDTTNSYDIPSGVRT